MVSSHQGDLTEPRSFTECTNRRRCAQPALCAGRSWPQSERCRILKPSNQGPGALEAEGEDRTKELSPRCRASHVGGTWGWHVGVTWGTLKMRKPRLHPRPITSASLEVVPPKAGLLNPQVISGCGQGCKPGWIHGSPTSYLRRHHLQQPNNPVPGAYVPGVWGGAQELAFLTSSQGMPVMPAWCRPPGVHPEEEGAG